MAPAATVTKARLFNAVICFLPSYYFDLLFRSLIGPEDRACCHSWQPESGWLPALSGSDFRVGSIQRSGKSQQEAARRTPDGFNGFRWLQMVSYSLLPW